MLLQFLVDNFKIFYPPAVEGNGCSVRFMEPTLATDCFYVCVSVCIYLCIMFCVLHIFDSRRCLPSAALPDTHTHTGDSDIQAET